MNKTNLKGICRYGAECYRLNPLHLKEYSHPHIENIIKSDKVNGKYTIPSDLFIAEDILLKQIEIVEPLIKRNLYYEKQRNNDKCETENAEKKIKLDVNKDEKNKNDSIKIQSSDKVPKEPSNVAVLPSISCQIPSTSKLEQKKIQKARHKIEDYVKVVLPKGEMAKKLENAKPFNFFLTAITSSKPTHSEPLTITFQEILDKSLGEIESSVQINFMIDVGWLLSHYYFSENETKPLLILYGDETPELRLISSKKPNIQTVKVEMPGPFSTHHTKMMIFLYTDGSMRVVISTANLYEDDWHNRTQGLWMSPKCPKLPSNSPDTAGESPTGFKDSFIKYLSAYKIPKLQPWIVQVRETNFSEINVFLITSTPGGHRNTSSGHLFGHPRLGDVLGKHCAHVEDNVPITVQSSSIGSLGPNVNSWIIDEFFVSLRKDSTPSTLRKMPEFRMIYPSFDNVINGHDGILSGGCLPYGKATDNKQLWLKNHLYQWKSKKRHRNQAMPHIKTYSRWANDKLFWFCLTSANLSKAAWGAYNKSAKFEKPLRINNYEAGVLFLPKFVNGNDHFSLENFPMPYDVPLVKYNADDVPFVSDLIV